VAENSTVGTTVGTVAGVDSNAGDSADLQPGEQRRRALRRRCLDRRDHARRRGRLRGGVAHTIVVRVTDANGATYDETMALSVTDVTRRR
jgi:hypothetical protein